MRQDIEQIFQEALASLKQGRPKTEVLLAFPERRQELEPLLNVAMALTGLPKKIVPEPSMRRKYILAPAKSLWLGWVHVSRWAAVSSSAVLLLAAVAGTGYATIQSAPGETLFTLKKAAEHLQVQFATSQEAKISLQVQIAQKRLTDAQSAIQNSPNDPGKETAALAELSAETTNSINALDQATQDKTSPLLAKTDHPLVASLENITSQQQVLVKNLSRQTQLGDSAKNALQASQKNVAKVAQIKATLEAAGNDNSLAKLDSNPSAVTASGTIDSIVNNLLTLDNNIFIIDDQTIIKNSDNNKVAKINLAAKQKIMIVGDKTDMGLVARQITLLEQTPEQGMVKGASTTAAASSTNLITAQQPPALDPNTAIGSFIMEDPAPQTDYNH